jgi:hypothetical protein
MNYQNEIVAIQLSAMLLEGWELKIVESKPTKNCFYEERDSADRIVATKSDKVLWYIFVSTEAAQDALNRAEELFKRGCK